MFDLCIISDTTRHRISPYNALYIAARFENSHARIYIHAPFFFLHVRESVCAAIADNSNHHFSLYATTNIISHRSFFFIDRFPSSSLLLSVIYCTTQRA